MTKKQYVCVSVYPVSKLQPVSQSWVMINMLVTVCASQCLRIIYLLWTKLNCLIFLFSFLTLASLPSACCIIFIGWMLNILENVETKHFDQALWSMWSCKHDMMDSVCISSYQIATCFPIFLINYRCVKHQDPMKNTHGGPTLASETKKKYNSKAAWAHRKAGHGKASVGKLNRTIKQGFARCITRTCRPSFCM